MPTFALSALFRPIPHPILHQRFTLGFRGKAAHLHVILSERPFYLSPMRYCLPFWQVLQRMVAVDSVDF